MGADRTIIAPSAPYFMQRSEPWPGGEGCAGELTTPRRPLLHPMHRQTERCFPGPIT